MMAYVPFHYGHKKPLQSNWNLRENCVTSKADSHKLAGHNIALAHAYCDPPTCSLDIDDTVTALPILKSLGFDVETTDAPVCKSGRENSLKAFFRLDDPLELHQVEIDGVMSFEYRCATKSGLTVADLIPPSRHPNGTNYSWINKRNLRSLPKLPKALRDDWLNRIAAKRVKKVATVRARSLSFACDSPSDEALLRKLLSYINPNCDRDTWLKVIFSALSTELTNAISIAQDWSEGAPDRFDQRDFSSTIDSYREGHYSTGTLYYYAKQGGYRGSRK
jgi:hypothetical protein